MKIDTAYDDRTTILYYYPGMHPDLVDALVEKGYRGIVIAGTGLGHVNKPLYPAFKRAVASGVHRRDDRADAMGLRADVRVRHGTGSMDIGVVPLDNIWLPETALMKLSWVLGHTDDRRK